MSNFCHNITHNDFDMFCTNHRQTSFAPSQPCSCRIVFIHHYLLLLCSPTFIELECSLRPYPFICGLPWPSIYSAPIGGSSGSHDCGTDSGRPSLWSLRQLAAAEVQMQDEDTALTFITGHSPFFSLLLKHAIVHFQNPG